MIMIVKTPGSQMGSRSSKNFIINSATRVSELPRTFKLTATDDKQEVTWAA